MAATKQQTNFITSLQTFSTDLIGISQQIDRVIADWNLNGYSTMADADVKLVNADLSIAKVTAAITSLQALQTSFGDFVSGNRVNLEKMRT